MRWLKETKVLALGERASLDVVKARMWGNHKVVVLLADGSTYMLSYPDGVRLVETPVCVAWRDPDPRLVAYYDRKRHAQ